MAYTNQDMYDEQWAKYEELKLAYDSALNNIEVLKGDLRDLYEKNQILKDKYEALQWYTTKLDQIVRVTEAFLGANLIEHEIITEEEN